MTLDELQALLDDDVLGGEALRIAEGIMQMSEAGDMQRHVAEILLANIDSHENMEDYVQDVLSYGCASGAVSGMIYYSETNEFFETHKDSINDALADIRQELGAQAWPPNGWDEEDPLAMGVVNRNLLAWLAFEKTVYDFCEIW